MSKNNFIIQNSEDNTFLELSDISNNQKKIIIQTSNKSQMNDLHLTGNLRINTDKFIVNANNGNVTIDNNLNILGEIPFGMSIVTGLPSLVFGNFQAIPTGFEYENRKLSGYIIRNGDDKYCYLSIYIHVKTIGSYPDPSDQALIVIPSNLNPITGRRWIFTYIPNNIGGLGGDPNRYPFCYLDGTPVIYLSRWTSSPDPEIAEQPLQWDLFRDGSIITVNMFFKIF